MSVLASGSTGNATYVESEKGSLLVDVGLTGKKMEEHMNTSIILKVLVS